MQLYQALLLGRALMGIILPSSDTVPPGVTIAIPVAGERAVVQGVESDYPIGYGYNLDGTIATDGQRGSLIAVMCAPAVATTMAQCQGSSQRVDLTVRYVTRLYPDSASQAGIDNKVWEDTPSNTKLPMSGQVLAFLNIPASLDATLFPTCSQNPVPPTCFTKLPYTVYLGRHPPIGSDDTTSLQTVGTRNIELVHGAGTANSNLTVYTGTPPHIDRFVPYPKVVFAVDTASENNVSAADLTIAIPPNVVIKDVFEEEHLGRHTMVRWQQPTGGTIQVQLVSPDKNVNRIAVVFTLTSGTPPTFADFPVTKSVLYDAQGSQMSTGSFTPRVIR